VRYREKEERMNEAQIERGKIAVADRERGKRGKNSCSTAREIK
jgi:hypothetical protein